MHDLNGNPPKYDTIGLGYNVTRKADSYLMDRLYHLLEPDRNCHYLDVGCGTGNYTCALAERGLKFTGLDPSKKMLGEAKLKTGEINWIEGRVEELPFPDHYFDGSIATLTIHHWENIERGFSEISRVLKPGSRIVLFTSSPEQMSGYWLNNYFPALIERSAEKMPTTDYTLKALVQSGFNIKCVEKYFVRDDLEDLFLQSGKNRPEIYFDENVRKGISTFSALAHTDEVEAGLQKLRDDLKSNRFPNIKLKYDNDLGDYLFIVGEKVSAG